MLYYGITLKGKEVLARGNRLFGTSGVRNVINEDLSPGFYLDIARAIGTILPLYSRVCIATDTRLSREILKSAIRAGLLSSGIDVVELGILPTPALAFLTRAADFDTGIMVTASHNPPEYNGIKLFNRNSLGYSRNQEIEIETVYAAGKFRNSHSGTVYPGQKMRERYFEFIQARFANSNFNRNLKIVVDPGNGAASGFARELLSRIGFEVMPLNDKPDGSFPGRNPEPKEDTLLGTVEFLRQQNADLAVCFDGDADRVVFCDKKGFLGLDEMIAFVSRMAVEESGKRQVATTVETGRLLDLTLRELGVEVVRGRVGDVNVAYLTQQLDAAIGVEPVGIYIMPEVGYYPDSLFATLTVLSRIREVDEIRDLFKGMPRLFSGKRKLPCPESLRTPVMEELKENSGLFGTSQLNTLDGLRFEFDDSWVLIRASGTEPAIRVMAESNSMAEIEGLLEKGVHAVESILERLTV